METLNAASLTPVSVLSERRTEPRKIPSLPSLFQPKFTKSITSNAIPSKFSEVLSSKVNAGLVFLSSVLNAGIAKALTYEEALGQSVSSSSSDSSSDFDVGGVIDSVISFGTENPAVLIGGATFIAVPLVLSQILKKPKPWGVESAKSAYGKLGEVADAQLLDIRKPLEIKEAGSPDVRGLKKKVIPIVYKGEDKLRFLKKLSLKFKEPENTTLFILDKFDGNSELVAELVTANGFKAAYAIKDGAEGTRGWMNSGLPWISPKKTLSIDFGNLADSFSDALGEGAGALPVAFGLAAATTLSLFAFTEIETILELLGSAALVQLLSKKLLYAEDRKKTLQQVDEFLNTKIAPKELVDDIKQIGKALLPVTEDKKVLAAPAVGIADAVLPNTVEVKAELKPEPEVKAAAETPSVNSVPKAEVKAESLPGLSGSLSPYPYYPDFKPPTSPSPSQP
ncbi:Thylakoid rhodanese-like protein [Thalictrum thalictroides]|uniref:Thylakoid rhodanese-like protein n=1 Tax=Thalictrum thalictroides TaxID=46969 RepID=A0A7J6WC73_THATH|nr:Thylakoid rhodanese-like protein [Thalictrum thalictroides]